MTKLLEDGVPANQILISSDGNGAPPKEEKGEAVPTRANYMPVSSLHMIWRRLILEGRANVETARINGIAECGKGLSPETEGRDRRWT